LHWIGCNLISKQLHSSGYIYIYIQACNRHICLCVCLLLCVEVSEFVSGLGLFAHFRIIFVRWFFFFFFWCGLVDYLMHQGWFWSAWLVSVLMLCAYIHMHNSKQSVLL
jgi:hypothetical protein